MTVGADVYTAVLAVYLLGKFRTKAEQGSERGEIFRELYAEQQFRVPPQGAAGKLLIAAYKLLMSREGGGRGAAYKQHPYPHLRDS